MKYVVTIEREESPKDQVENKYPKTTEIYKQVVESPIEYSLVRDVISAVNKVEYPLA